MFTNIVVHALFQTFRFFVAAKQRLPDGRTRINSIKTIFWAKPVKRGIAVRLVYCEIGLGITPTRKYNQFEIAHEQVAVVVGAVKIQRVAPMRDALVAVGPHEQAEIHIGELRLKPLQKDIRPAKITLPNFFVRQNKARVVPRHQLKHCKTVFRGGTERLVPTVRTRDKPDFVAKATTEAMARHRNMILVNWVKCSTHNSHIFHDMFNHEHNRLVKVRGKANVEL